MAQSSKTSELVNPLKNKVISKKLGSTRRDHSTNVRVSSENRLKIDIGLDDIKIKGVNKDEFMPYKDRY